LTITDKQTISKNSI